ncbi:MULTISPECIES: TolC family protein [Acinetobacter]|uniref:TolC family protein n=4 Tax=Acinetobacter TaxID=469 RepID=A0A7T7WGJ5_9GAMM|nr:MULTISPECIES: TolC family protein [Acinetobacter]MBF4519760.1 TolC family protein [Acinetobacter towneri]MEB6563917.1 TolC family protein [Acinetobacter towneri]NHB64020.1 TolC family protein [Acinetobacter sp. GFQ9D191M]NHC00789.1 TolC family protein [Acinetobacter sp. GFQ9D192M]QQN87321.1 TolC family protein [Acinetobacter variabilis]
MNMKKNKQCVCWGLTVLASMMYGSFAYAQSISFKDAEQQLLQRSYSSQAFQSLEQASKLEAEAVKGIGLPRVDLNVRAYAFHSEVDIPLKQFKNNLENSLSQGVNGRLNEWEASNGVDLPAGITDPLREGLNNTIHSGVGLIPDTSNVVLEDQVIRPTVSVMMPLYTGGLTRSAKEIANIQSGRSELSNQQQQDTQRFELIQSYFNVQLQKQLLDAALFNSNAMQQHYRNALKLEQQGFISKGQRMQFEVARNNAERAQQNAQANLNAALFQLNNLLLDSNITELSTPLFVNRAEPQNVNILLSSFSQNSPLIKKMQMDTELAKANVKAQQAAKKPNVFAFGEYSLDQHQNWIVGVAARYNLFSGIDKNKNIQAAELKRYAAELMTARTQQEIENLIYKSFSEAVSAQQSDALLQQNLKAAQENLRIQELSFKEDVGTATQVIDAQNMLSSLKAEMALNAFKYVMSLATLLQSHGSIVEFPNYMQHANTHYIR